MSALNHTHLDTLSWDKASHDSDEYLQAARYQMIVMFIIASTTSVASVGTISLAAFHIVDSQTRLRSDLLKKRERHNSWTARLERRVSKVNTSEHCTIAL